MEEAAGSSRLVRNREVLSLALHMHEWKCVFARIWLRSAPIG